MAWRNSNRCIGRLLWDTLHVFDARDLLTAEDAYQKLIKHIDLATNDGKIQSTITIFAPRKDQEDPIRAATTHIYHKRYNNDILTPNYFYQPDPQEI